MSSVRAVVFEQHIRAMVESFYDRVRRDPDLGPVFEPRIGDAWPEHLDRMVDFWSSVLLGTRRFHGNPLARHRAIAELRSEHFDRWLELFAEVLDEVYPAHVAADILGRARRMRLVLDPGPSPDANQPLKDLPTTRTPR